MEITIRQTVRSPSPMRSSCRLGEMASGKDVDEDQQILARALIGVINSQAQLAELMRQIMQFVTEQKSE